MCGNIWGYGAKFCAFATATQETGKLYVVFEPGREPGTNADEMTRDPPRARE